MENLIFLVQCMCSWSHIPDTIKPLSRINFRQTGDFLKFNIDQEKTLLYYLYVAEV